jgi:hypothetical protein
MPVPAGMAADEDGFTIGHVLNDGEEERNS